MNDLEKIIKNPLALQKQMEGQYQLGLAHVQNQRITKRQVHKKLLEQPKAGLLKSRALWRYMKLWMAINTLDGIDVEFFPLGEDIPSDLAGNTNKVAKVDYKTMDMFNVDWQVKWNVGLLGLGVKAFTGWDSINKVPVVQSIDPLAVIPDPQYMHAKDMRFIGFEQRANIYSLSELDGYFGIKEILERKGQVNQEVQLNQDAIYNANNYPVVIDDDGMIDIYNHYIFYEGKKYLTSWIGDRKILIKIIEIEPRTKAEKKDPRKISYPVEFFRSNPILGLFFGASFWDEIGQYADSETILDNLEIILARKIAMGEDKLVDTSILDIKSLNNKKPGGRWIPVKREEGVDLRASIFSIPEGNPGQLPQYVNQKNRQRQEETTAISNVAFGISPDGNQTKGEIQTLQENLNNLLSYSKTIMLHSEKRVWEIWYTYYIYNLSGKSKKFISINKGNGVRDIYNFKKSEFIVDVPVDIEVKSKAEERVKRERKFARFQILMGTIIQNLKPGSYAFNQVIREYLTLGDLEREKILQFMPYTIDELEALEGLVLLEKGDKPSSPKDGQDYDVFINYYSNAKDSEIKNEIIQEYIDAKKIQDAEMKKKALLGAGNGQDNPGEGETGNVDNIAQGQVGNMLSQQNGNKMPSTQDLKGI